MPPGWEHVVKGIATGIAFAAGTLALLLIGGHLMGVI